MSETPKTAGIPEPIARNSGPMDKTRVKILAANVWLEFSNVYSLLNV